MASSPQIILSGKLSLIKVELRRLRRQHKEMEAAMKGFLDLLPPSTARQDQIEEATIKRAFTSISLIWDQVRKIKNTLDHLSNDTFCVKMLLK